jgi:hypothetical protein
LASNVVDLARDVTIRAMETVNRARDAADMATEATSAAGRGTSLTLMTWNARRLLSSGSELALLHLLTSADVDVTTVTECEILETVKDFAVAGYTTFFTKVPEGKSKTRVLVERDKRRSNKSKLNKSLSDPTSCGSLPTRHSASHTHLFNRPLTCAGP